MSNPNDLDTTPNIVMLPTSLRQADLPATARAITDADERRQVLSRILANLGRDNLDEWLDKSPLVEVQFEAS